jgi:hypothetical protein
MATEPIRRLVAVNVSGVTTVGRFQVTLIGRFWVTAEALKPPRTMRIADRRHHWKTRIKNWLPVCAWAGLIFFFSTDNFSSANTTQIFGFVLSWLWPEMPIEDIAPVHGAMRKLGHWAHTSSWQF